MRIKNITIQNRDKCEQFPLFDCDNTYYKLLKSK